MSAGFPQFRNAASAVAAWCCFVLATITLLSPVAALPQNSTGSLRQQLQAEVDPVRKAKLLAKVGEAQLGLLRSEAAAGRYEGALKAIEIYRDDVKATLAALKASGRDAEKKPAGFKQLQIHLRKSIREFNQTILSLPVDMRQFFEPVRDQLQAMDQELIEALFPRQPGRRVEGNKPKG